MQKRKNTNALVAQHAGHDVMVRGGVVMCDTCDRTVLDDSGSRPGLVADNQQR